MWPFVADSIPHTRVASQVPERLWVSSAEEANDSGQDMAREQIEFEVGQVDG